MKVVKILPIILAALLLAGHSVARAACVTADCHAGLAGKSIHPGETPDCGACHIDTEDKHAKGDKAPPALKGGMCASCHDDVLKYQYLHSPVTAKNCHLCHNPHGDLERKLLPAGYSDQLFINYDKESYKLCFSCHKRDLLMFPDTSYSTEFRNGMVNLHYLHVNKTNRGRSCKLCHGMHGADQPKLMADRVSFGNWRMPVGFAKTETGGSCAPGCHEPRLYDRKAKSAPPPPPRAPAAEKTK
ncbi:MAG: cytochrome c3 family protein [Deltaproteobacteria bacterium]|nr:cytochrome c3 family protein [Deltaproteobacteria bacterium]